MNKLDYKDNLNTAVHGAVIENQMLHDYLSDIESLVVKFEQDINHDNMVALAYEVTALIERMLYLNNGALDKLHDVQTLIDTEIEEVEADAEVHD
ncbi:hypothetical protein ACEE19_01230 [Aerococcus suis]